MTSELRPMLFSEKPYAAVVSEKYFEGQKICSFCFKFPPRTFRCTKCRLVSYCGAECQKEDWNSGQHRRECKVFAAIPENQLATLRDNPGIRLIARVLARKDKDQGVTNGSEVVTDQEMKLRKLMDLCTHAEFISDAKFQYACSAFHLLYRCRSQFFMQFDQDIFRQVMGLVETNTIMIPDYDILGQLDLGTGLYLQFSRFNHSCEPDLAVFWEGGATMHMRLLKPITLSQTDLDTLTITYSLGNSLALTHERREYFEKVCHFKCECSMCQNEKLDRIKECSVVEKCPKCKQGLVVTLEGKAELECLNCGKKVSGKGKEATAARAWILRLRQEKADGKEMKVDLLAIIAQATQRLDPVRNIFLLHLWEKAMVIKWESFKYLKLISDQQSNPRSSIFKSAEGAQWYKGLSESVSQVAATYRFYGAVGCNFPVLCAMFAQVHMEAGNKEEAKRWFEEARDLWADIVCSPGHHCVTDIQDKIDRL